MERLVLFADDIANVALENIERISQSNHQTSLVNPQPAKVAKREAHGTTITMDSDYKQETVASEHFPTTTSHRRSNLYFLRPFFIARFCCERHNF